MQYVIYDIETNFTKSEMDKEHVSECVELAAVKVSSEDFSKIETFHTYIKPTHPITRFTKKLSGITEEHVKNAPSFPQVLADFQAFVGQDACLVSWGQEDLRFLLHDCELHQIKKWEPQYQIDIQEVVQFGLPDLFDQTQTPSLKRAVKVFKIKKQGKEHSALDDSMNTFHIFHHVYHQIDVHGHYRIVRSAEERFTNDKGLSMTGEKYFIKWISRYMRDHQTFFVTSEEFFASEDWKQLVSHYGLEPLLPLYQKKFSKFKERAKKKYQEKLLSQIQENQLNIKRA